MSKVTLWTKAGELIDRQTRVNASIVTDGLRRLDIEGIGSWLMGALSRYSGYDVEAVIPVGHGAGVVALIDDAPAFEPLDYEQPIPPDMLAAYRATRDPFALTGSPALPDGLNLGAQLFWLDRIEATAMQRATLLPWAQYWAWFLSGVAVSEVTSLGCHTDLWCPAAADFSPLARRMGWAPRFAPLAGAGDAIGMLRPALAAATGLPATTRIHAGLHDSNAALLAARGFAELAGQEATVLSTGTWFVAMRSTEVPTDPATLPAERDCLVNVDVAGRAVPSARFMGGREIELLGERIDKPGCEGLADTLLAEAMVMPSQRWIDRPADAEARAAAVALYAALMAAGLLEWIGSRRLLLIEGRFAAAEIFTRALASLRPDLALFVAGGETDVSFGALRLLRPDIAASAALIPVEPLPRDLSAYRDAWHDNRTIFA